MRLVSERHLRQILNYLSDRGHPLPAETDLPFWIARTDLVAAGVLPRAALAGSEPRLLLVTDADDRLISGRPREEQLRVYWRVLFRAAVMKTIDVKLAAGTLTARACRARLDAFGPAAAREVRFVLETEHLIVPDASDEDVYRIFAAVYLELDHFTAHAVEEFFPALPHGHAVRDVLAEDVAAEELLARSCPAGAAEPEREPPPDERWLATPAATITAPPVGGGCAALLRKATDAESRGNGVRAAILRTQAALATTGIERERAAEGAVAALRRLVDRLGDMLEWDTDTREEWRQALGPLLPPAAAGVWPRAARCLYELQRIPADYGREVYAVDLPEYVRTLGARPVRRHLPHARPVMVLMALRKAQQQLLRAHLGEPEQLRLDRLLHHEIHRREHDIRHTITPIIVEALTSAGLLPCSRVEVVARDKLVAELLDRVCESGYLRISDLRDAVARNQLKLHDLAGPGEFVGGDALLRADTRMAYALDGVYRRGEFYLRWIQRFVSVFFGTRWGRALTLYVALPFGGAFLTLMFAEELRHIGGKVGSFVARSFESSGAPVPRPTPQPPPAPQPSPPPPPTPIPPPAPEPVVEDKNPDYSDETEPPEKPPAEPPLEPLPEQPAGTLDRLLRDQQEHTKLVQDVLTSSATQHLAHHGSFLVQWSTILGFGVFLLLVIHIESFSRVVLRALGYVWRVTRGILWDIPMGVWRSQPVRMLRVSGVARFFDRHFASPLLISLIVIGVLLLTGFSPLLLSWYGWIVFVVLLVLYNTPFGWVVQDRISEALSDWWRRVRVNMLPGLLGAIIDTFRALANWVERQLYAVDEWMRFRGGDSQTSLALKALLGLIWFPVAYVTRFVFYLLVEPQVNPVKHFPVVTVSHKVIWPMVPQLAEMTGQTPWTVGMVVNGVPGIFGFIAWELKENWRLYAANRPPRLTPVMVGSHGESMRGLLRPGFHSGTVPKLYRKTRRALAAADRAKVVRLHHNLEHAMEGVHRFAERELLPLLAGSRAWGGAVVEVAAVRFGVQRAEVELAAPALGRGPFVLALENVNGVINASIDCIGWADKLTDAQRGVFTFALRGLLDMAAAARYDGRERTCEVAAGPGYAALARPVSWAEWVTHFEEVRG